MKTTPGAALHEERQQVAEDLRRNGDDPVGRQQRAEHVGVAVRVQQGQLRQHAGRQAQVAADREDVPAADAAADADDQLVLFEGRRQASTNG